MYQVLLQKCSGLVNYSHARQDLSVNSTQDPYWVSLMNRVFFLAPYDCHTLLPVIFSGVFFPGPQVIPSHHQYSAEYSGGGGRASVSVPNSLSLYLFHLSSTFSYKWYLDRTPHFQYFNSWYLSDFTLWPRMQTLSR